MHILFPATVCRSHISSAPLPSFTAVGFLTPHATTSRFAARSTLPSPAALTEAVFRGRGHKQQGLASLNDVGHHSRRPHPLQALQTSQSRDERLCCHLQRCESAKEAHKFIVVYRQGRNAGQGRLLVFARSIDRSITSLCFLAVAVTIGIGRDPPIKKATRTSWKPCKRVLHSFEQSRNKSGSSGWVCLVNESQSSTQPSLQ